MPFTDAPVLPKPSGPGTGISMSMREMKGGRFKVRLTFTAAMQQQLWGGSIAGKRFSIRIGRGSDEGKLQVVPSKEGEFVASDGVKGSASFSVGAWDLLPKGQRPAAAVTVGSMGNHGIVELTLPAWCRPSGTGGKMEAEFGLKRTAGK